MGVLGRVLVAICSVGSRPTLTLGTPVPITVAEALVHGVTSFRRYLLPVGGGTFVDVTG